MNESKNQIDTTAPDISRRKFLKLALLSGFGTLIGSYPVFIERYAFQVNTYRIPVPNLPPKFHHFRIVQLTDLHYGFLMPLLAVEYIIDTINGLDKDVVVCTGDYIHERNGTAQIDAVWPRLMKLRARYGVYSILGNHDHWGNTDRSLYWLKRSGQDLRHQAKPVVRGGERIWLGGAGDYWEDELGIDKAFRGVPPNECKILLAHNPDSADTRFNSRVDLMISGHTHGGQVVLPWLGAPVLPVQNPNYSSGFIRTAGTNIYISRGLGWSILPIRFNCFPEISVLELVRQGAAERLTAR